MYAFEHNRLMLQSTVRNPIDMCCARESHCRAAVLQQSSACAFRVGFTPMIITYIRNSKKKIYEKRVYASPDNVPSYCCARMRIHIYLQCPRQYIDTAAAARDSAEIITNVYISIIYILCYSIILYPSRENPFGFGCSDNVSPGCIFWYDFMILIFFFHSRGVDD